MDSDSTLVNAVDAETTPIGSANQGVSLPQDGRGGGQQAAKHDFRKSL
jgi:hypothetical protein